MPRLEQSPSHFLAALIPNPWTVLQHPIDTTLSSQGYLFMEERVVLSACWSLTKTPLGTRQLFQGRVFYRRSLPWKPLATELQEALEQDKTGTQRKIRIGLSLDPPWTQTLLKGGNNYINQVPLVIFTGRQCYRSSYHHYLFHPIFYSI